MSTLALNENVHNAILEFIENKAEVYAERDSYAHVAKAEFSPATLINEWYEARSQNNRLTQNLPLISEYTDHYRDLCKYLLPDRKNYFKAMFDNQGFGQELLMDHLGRSYYNNFTTTYDLCYNHLGKGLCGPFPRTYQKGKYLPESDLTLIYGNLTQTGITKEKLRQQVQQVDPRCDNQVPKPEYRSEFVSYDMKEVKRLNDFPFRGKKKSDLLGIDTGH